MSRDRNTKATEIAKEKRAMNTTMTAQFFSMIDDAARGVILANIAKHYGITSGEAYIEVTDEEAEHLLDYVTGEVRWTTMALMQRHGF